MTGLRALVGPAMALALVVGACGPSSSPTAPPVTISVAAAADLRFALDEIIAAYERDRPAIDVVASYGSSGNFYSQIENGAPFDVYFSADIEYPRRLEAAGLAPAGSTRLYAVGRIVVWVRTDSPIDVETLGVDAVVDPSVKRISIANPEHAPYGRAAVSALRNAGLYDLAADRLVLGENVSQAAQFVGSGAAEIGIIAYSLALAPTLGAEGRFALVPAALHPPIEQGVVIVDRTAAPGEAGQFLDYVLGPHGRAVLERFGFVLPEVGRGP